MSAASSTRDFYDGQLPKFPPGATTSRSVPAKVPLFPLTYSGTEYVYSFVCSERVLSQYFRFCPVVSPLFVDGVVDPTLK